MMRICIRAPQSGHPLGVQNTFLGLMLLVYHYNIVHYAQRTFRYHNKIKMIDLWEEVHTTDHVLGKNKPNRLVPLIEVLQVLLKSS
jgi:hypothetical protein